MLDIARILIAQCRITMTKIAGECLQSMYSISQFEMGPHLNSKMNCGFTKSYQEDVSSLVRHEIWKIDLTTVNLESFFINGWLHISSLLCDWILFQTIRKIQKYKHKSKNTNTNPKMQTQIQKCKHKYINLLFWFQAGGFMFILARRLCGK